MTILSKTRSSLLILCSLFLSSCGDFPDYRYDQSQDYCVLKFPFAGGIIGRKYIGYFQIISSLQYLDADPSYKIIVTGPSGIELEPGSFQKLIIDDQTFIPKFQEAHLEAELQLWGPTFIFTKEQSSKIYDLLRQGYDMNILGRIEVGHQYDTDIYNYFFDSADQPFRVCINRLLDEEDLQQLKIEP